MNVWELSYLAPESLRKRQRIADQLERVSIGLWCLRRREALLGVSPPYPMKLPSDFFKGVRTARIALSGSISCPVCGMDYYRVHWCKKTPAANRDSLEIDPRG
jgi:hypothetical protein